MRTLKLWPCRTRYLVCLFLLLLLPLLVRLTNAVYVDMQSAQDDLQKKNQELNDLCREKTTKLSQMTNLYNLLKSRAMRSRMQTAASDTVSQTLTSLNAPPTSIPLATRSPRGQMSSSKFPRTPLFPVNKDGVEQLHRHQRSGTGSSKGARSRTSGEHPMPPPSTRPSWDGRNGLSHPLSAVVYK